jgi:hypothetical protein
MHSECIGKTAAARYKLFKANNSREMFAYAVVTYVGKRAQRVVMASDDVYVCGNVADRMWFKDTSNAVLIGFADCRPLRKRGDETATVQELHIRDIDKIRKCRTCSSKDRSKTCKPVEHGTAEEKAEALKELAKLKAAR